jgi:hypothetical protein
MLARWQDPTPEELQAFEALAREAALADAWINRALALVPGLAEPETDRARVLACRQAGRRNPPAGVVLSPEWIRGELRNRRITQGEALRFALSLCREGP